MKQYGTVVEINGNIARVECERQSACDMCENAEHCAEKCTKVYATAINEVNACIGDLVEIQTDTKKVLLNAFIVFILPIFLSVAAYFATYSFLGEKLAVVATFIVLVPALCLFSFLLNRSEKKRVISRILRVL